MYHKDSAENARNDTSTAFRLFTVAEGSKLFTATALNILLTIVTLGLYWPWAKASIMRYQIGTLELGGSRFVFHGTGKEMFKGFLMAALAFILLNSIHITGTILHNDTLIAVGYFVLYAGILSLLPVIIHGSLRYRLSRTTWRGIRLGYKGDLKQLYGIFIPGALLSLVTLGLYSPFLFVATKRYIYQHIRFGHLEFEYDGVGSEVFMMRLKNLLLILFTFGWYGFAAMRDELNYDYGHTILKQDGKVLRFHAKFKATELFTLGITSYFLSAFTLGLAFPWIWVNYMKYTLSSIVLQEPLLLDRVVQSQQIDRDASGDMMGDLLDLDIVF
ncbi:MAG: DUF898 family protein [Cytophagales bacterium]|nr:MAG: DUF898 family protein [Cytophagales bacterium]